jgi:hypothetical protein
MYSRCTFFQLAPGRLSSPGRAEGGGGVVAKGGAMATTVEHRRDGQAGVRGYGDMGKSCSLFRFVWFVLSSPAQSSSRPSS